MKIRRLNPANDKSLYREAYQWGRNRRWFREVENKFGAKVFSEFVEDAKRPQQADVGIFENDKIAGLLTLVLQGNGIYEAHIRVSKECDTIAFAAWARIIRSQLFRDLGAYEIFGQIPRFNAGAINLAEQCGLYRDGMTVIQGQLRNHVIEWVRLSVNRSQWETEEDGQEKNYDDAAE